MTRIDRVPVTDYRPITDHVNCGLSRTVSELQLYSCRNYTLRCSQQIHSRIDTLQLQQIHSHIENRTIIKYFVIYSHLALNTMLCIHKNATASGGLPGADLTGGHSCSGRRGPWEVGPWRPPGLGAPEG